MNKTGSETSPIPKEKVKIMGASGFYEKYLKLAMVSATSGTKGVTPPPTRVSTKVRK